MKMIGIPEGIIFFHGVCVIFRSRLNHVLHFRGVKAALKESPPKISAKLMQWPGTVRTVPWGEICWWKKSGDHCLGYRKPCKQWDKLPRKTAAWFLPSTVWRGNDCSWTDSFPHWMEGNYMKLLRRRDGSHPPKLHPTGHLLVSPSNSIPIYPGTRAAKVVYTQVGASIKETVRGHSRQIELCSVTWWRWCRLARGQGLKKGRLDRLKKLDLGWRNRKGYAYIYIWII